MKKWMLLLTTIVLLLGMSAHAVSMKSEVVVQNEQAPQLVAVSEEAGMIQVGTVYGADGSVSKVWNEGSLVLTDVHGRTSLTDEEAATRLTAAYESLMAGVHFSDVPTLAYNGILADEINAALARHSDELTAHDLFVYELFDAAVKGEPAAVMTEGGRLEFTVQLAENQALPLLLIYTSDGMAWQVLDSYETGAGKTVTIRLSQPGVVGFLQSSKPAAHDSDAGREEEDVIDPDGGDEEENETYTPSVTGQEAPAIQIIPGEDGERYAGVIEYENSDEKVGIPAEMQLMVTALAERDYVADLLTHEHLEWAYDEVLAAEKPEELEAGLCEQLDAMLEAAGYETVCDALAVRDLFEITVYGEYVKYFYDEEAYLKISFETDVPQGMPFVVLFSSDSVTWQVLPAEKVAIRNGTVTLKLHELGVIAFVSEKTEDALGLDTVLAPE